MSDHYDVIIIGAGPTGVTAALGAARHGASVLLIESGPTIGGNATSGLPILGCCNSRGQWVVGGAARRLFDACDRLDGYIGAICDWRTLYGVCVSPDILRLVMTEQLAAAGVRLLLYSFVEAVTTDGGQVVSLAVFNKKGVRHVRGRFIVDTSGDADVAAMAGASFDHGGENGEFQPVSLVFRLSHVDFDAALSFVRDHPEEVLLAENPVFNKTPVEAARALYDAGYPYFALAAKGKLLGAAINAERMFPCTAVFMWPTSMRLREIGLNTTRVANIDATDPANLSSVLTVLSQQVMTAVRFMKREVPGFADAELAGVAPQIGVRETRRIIGEYELQTSDVLEGRKFDDGIAKGAHHVDIHGAGTYQKRIPVKDGQSYDIPYGCLIPKGLGNLLVAGRSLSSTREANGSARVMGTCMATGEAAGTAAALAVRERIGDARAIPIALLRQTLETQGAILQGTA